MTDCGPGLMPAFAAALVVGGVPAVAAAQETPNQGVSADESPSNGQDIVVTARRRDETLQSVPVTVTAITGEAIEARGITNLEGFAQTVPQLFIARSGGSFQGGALGLRGISAGDGNVFGDQAVAFNIDGVQIARSTPRTLSSFDLQQIEVMKGPQALFFGKNSPGGVVALHTADPGDRVEAGAKAAYEFNAREVRLEGFLSGPLTDSVGARVAVLFQDMEGWARNIATSGTPYSPDERRGPKSREFDVRTTLKFDNGGPFDARLKFTYGTIRGDGIGSNTQRVYCPLGVPQLGGPDDCTADNRFVRAVAGPRPGTGGANTVTGAPIAGVPVYGDGEPYSKIDQYLAGLELNYDLSDSLSLASITGYYEASVKTFDIFNAADPLFAFPPAAPAALGGMFYSFGSFDVREISEEIRLASDFSGPFNFMVGGYFQDQRAGALATAAANALNPVQFYPPINLRQDATAYSGFGSISLRPIEQFEISGGLRYSHEKKDFRLFRAYPGRLSSGATFVAGQEVPTTVPEKSFSNWSPEVTLTWRPSRRLMVFGGWKRGFLSGGFNGAGTGSAVAVVGDRSYDQQVVEGFEGGVKATLAPGLRLNFAAYDYDIIGLQVTAVLPGPPTTQVISNAASATSRGFEADMDWEASDNLTLRGGISYNRARYSKFDNSPCYGGQSIAAGCNGSLVGSAFTTQSLTGQALVRAPEWAGFAGASYKVRFANDSEVRFNVDTNYSSSYFTDALNSPGGLQKAYWLLDASALYQLSNGVELALIGRNLTNEYTFARSTGLPFTGTGSGTATSMPADQGAVIGRGREIRLQASYRF